VVTLSLTRSRTAAVLARAAGLLAIEGWEPGSDQRSLMAAIDRAAGCVPGKTSPDTEATATAAWEAVCAHLGVDDTRPWEMRPGRTEVDVLDTLRAACTRLSNQLNQE
jgi:hypothetical protein